MTNEEPPASAPQFEDSAGDCLTGQVVPVPAPDGYVYGMLSVFSDGTEPDFFSRASERDAVEAVKRFDLKYPSVNHYVIRVAVPAYVKTTPKE